MILSAAAAALVLGRVVPAAAADDELPGIARISSIADPALPPAPAPIAGVDEPSSPAPEAHSDEGVVYYEDCPPYGKGRLGLCLKSPDHGWSYPQRRPIYPLGARYHRYWPDYWHGQPVPAGYHIPSYPMVAAATDTAQLGFYYQHAPHWRPNPAMLPAFPRPWEIHTRYCDGPQCFPHAAMTYVCPQCGKVHELEMQPENGLPPAPDGAAPGFVPPAPKEAFHSLPSQLRSAR